MTLTDAPAPTEDHRKVVQKVGLVLAVVAGLDIAALAYCTARGWRSSDAVGILAVMAFMAATGAPLIWGSRKLAWLVAFYSAFVFALFAGAVLLMPFVLRLPLKLVSLYLRLQPLPTTGSAALLSVLLLLAWWTYRTLTKPVVLDAIDQQAGSRQLRPTFGFAMGAALLTFVLVLVATYLGSEGSRVREAARRKVGPGYQLFVWNAAAGSGGGGREVVWGDVIACSDHEIKPVHVEFERWR